jgi:hypothetical protein
MRTARRPVARFRLAFRVICEHDDGTAHEKVFRFPSRAWWGAVIMLYGGRLVTMDGPSRLRDGTIVTRRPDGCVEFLEPRRD